MNNQRTPIEQASFMPTTNRSAGQTVSAGFVGATLKDPGREPRAPQEGTPPAAEDLFIFGQNANVTRM